MRLERRRWHLRVFFILAVLVFVIYLVGVPHTPRGFCLDESSIAYNAHLIATTGHDEYREAWPLFFRAFGEYKNPIYIYLLAALFKFSGPSIAVARSFSAVMGVASVLLIAYLATLISKNQAVGIVVGLSAALTPWLYENSRLVFEVALYPALVAVFLIALFRASGHPRWSAMDIASIAATLALLTYSYSIGRLLAPLLALGLIIFATRERFREILLTWLAYAIALIPLFTFSRRHPGALTARFEGLTYIHSGSSAWDVLGRFTTNYAISLSPIRLLLTGEDNPRDHLAGTGCILLATFVLVLLGLWLILRRRRKERWWWFIIYALLVSIIPGALTVSIFPQIRLIVLPVLINVLTVPAWTFLFARVQINPKPKRAPTAIIAAILLATVAQGVLFQVRYHQKAPERGYVCDEKFPRKILAVALASLRSPIYLFDPPGRSGYVQSYWHGLLGGIDPSRFVRLPDGAAPPPGAVVISTEETCASCRLLARHLDFIVYTPLPSDLQPRSGQLPDDGFRADIKLAGTAPAFKAGVAENVTVLVKNISTATWPSVGADDGRFAMTVRSRWTKPGGTVVSTSIARPIYYGLDPGDVAGLSLTIVPPESSGDYFLSIDVVQEDVAWFSDRGSQALNLRAAVSP